MKYLRLSDCSDYSSERTSNITFENYISTENMLPNKGGVTVASSLPDVKSTSAYKKDDILLSNIRPYFCKIWLADKEGSCSNDVLVVRAKKGFDSKFLYYVLSDKNFFNWDTVTSKGTKMPRGTPKAIMKYFVPNVDLPTQQKIAGILSKYDEAIENNNKRIKLLEQMAQNLYKEWFVRFRFPGWQNAEFENGIPKGWKVARVGEYVKIKSGFAFKSEWWQEEGCPVVKIKDIDNGTLDTSELDCVSEEYAAKAKSFLLHEGDLVIAMTGATIGKIGLIPKINNLYTNQRVGKFFLGENPFEKMPIMYCLFSQFATVEMILCLSGASSAQPNISPEQLESIKFFYEERIVEKFNKETAPFFKMILKLRECNQNLSRQRDLLLPRLMSGKLQVFRK
jgi:type I restriction enzyme, S subunit